MKKFFLMVCGMALLSVSGASAQNGDFYAPGKRIGVGVGVGTEGIGIDASVSLTKWCTARVGVNIMPSVLTFKEDFDGSELGEVDLSGALGYAYPPITLNEPIEAEASLSRTQIEVKFDLYPFPNASSFFVCAGFSFAGNKLVKIKGHSDEARDEIKRIHELTSSEWYQQLPDDQKFGIDIDEYRIPINENGDVTGGMKVKGFRPYLGLGFGRLIPKNRIGFRFELGASFQGKPEIYADGVDLEKTLDEDVKNDISDIMDYLKVYPVIKFCLRGRIL